MEDFSFNKFCHLVTLMIVYKAQFMLLSKFCYSIKYVSCFNLLPPEVISEALVYAKL